MWVICFTSQLQRKKYERLSVHENLKENLKDVQKCQNKQKKKKMLKFFLGPSLTGKKERYKKGKAER